MALIQRQRLPFAMLGIVLGAILFAVLVTLFSAPDRAVVTGKAALLSPYRAPTTGGGVPAHWVVPSHFYRSWAHHKRRCGHRTSPELRGKRGVYRMFFQRCFMTEGPVSVYPYRKAPPRPGTTPTSTAQPHPTATSGSAAIGPPAPAPAPPTATPSAVFYWIPPVTSTSVPTPTAVPPPGGIQGGLGLTQTSDPVQYELSLMNQRDRASLGLPAYTLNSTQSTGNANCIGSLGHAQHMAAVGAISHDQFGYAPAGDICFQVAAGENVGMAGGYSVAGALDIINNEMMAEPIGPGIQNHHTSIISTTFHQVGIGVVTVGSSTFLCVDFLS